MVVPQEESKVDRLMRRFGRLLNRNRAQQNAEALTSGMPMTSPRVSTLMSTHSNSVGGSQSHS